MDSPLINVLLWVFAGYAVDYLVRELQHRGILPRLKDLSSGSAFQCSVRLVEQGTAGDEHARGGNRRQGEHGRQPETAALARVPVKDDFLPFAGKTASVVSVALLTAGATDPWVAVATVKVQEAKP